MKVFRWITLLLLWLAFLGANYRTQNFVVTAYSDEFAKEIGDTAEMCRADLARYWLGKEMPAWYQPCPMTVRVANRNGGTTTFVFDRGEVFDWRSNIQGSRERLLDSVLPHEITHMVLASYFRQPLPRWADEGAATSVEHRTEQAKYERRLIEHLQTGRGINFSNLLAMREYPQDFMPLYAQGHSLAQWLIEREGPKEWIAFVADGLRDEDWQRAVREHYGHQTLGEMQACWLDWVKDGRPTLAYACYGNVCGPSGCAPRARSPQVVIQNQRTRIVRPQIQQNIAPRQPPSGLTPIQPPTANVPTPGPDIEPDQPPLAQPATLSSAQPVHYILSREDAETMRECCEQARKENERQFTAMLSVAQKNESHQVDVVAVLKEIEATLGTMSGSGCDTSGLAKQSDLAALAERVKELETATNPANEPVPPQSPETHIVVVVDKTAPWWPHLSSEIEEAKETYHGIQVTGLPDFPIGVIPQAVVYENSVPVSIVRGEHNVVELLSRVARGGSF